MNETEQTYHVPVLLHESIEGMHIQPGGTYVDVTFGGGGHSKEILNTVQFRPGPGCRAQHRGRQTVHIRPEQFPLPA